MPNNLLPMSETKICRLCLEEILDDNFERLDDIKIRMLQILPLHLDVAISKDPKICSSCIQNLQLSFEFKTSCLSNNDYLKTYVGPCNIKLKLEEVIIKKVSLGIKCEEENVCRFCLDYFERNIFIETNNIEQDMLDKCLPEIDLNIAENPLTCNNCLESLQKQFNFMLNCAGNEEKISNFYSKDKILDLNDIREQIKIMKKESEKVNVQEQNIKIEVIDEILSNNLIKMEEEIEEVNEDDFCVKIEEINVDQGGRETAKKSNSCVLRKKVQTKSLPATSSLKKIFTCTICSHQTNRKANLDMHYITHVDPSEAKLYKCDVCDFTTKWRSDISVHIKRHKKPSEVTMYNCTKCPYTTKYKQHITRHTKKVHFSKEKHLRYKCTDCDYNTTERWILKQHYKNKHGVDNDVDLLNFPCRQCEYNGKSRDDIERHRKEKHIHKCQNCGYKTEKLSHFKEHVKKHLKRNMGEIYTCSDCGFETRYKKSLISHCSRHKTGEQVRK